MDEYKRDKFEEWFLFHEGDRGKYMLDRATEGPFAGDYRDGLVQGAWNAWRGAIDAVRGVAPNAKATGAEGVRVD